MALPKKGSRTIEIDNVPYRWAVRDNGDHWSVVVEQAETAGQALHVSISRYDRSDDISITPGVVARLAREAIRSGWVPDQIGETFKLTQIPPDLFD